MIAMKMKFRHLRQHLLIILTIISFIVHLFSGKPLPALPFLVPMSLLFVLLSVSCIGWSLIQRSGIGRIIPFLELISMTLCYFTGIVPIYLLVFPFSLLAVRQMLTGIPCMILRYGLLPVSAVIGLIPIDGAEHFRWVLLIVFSFLLILLTEENESAVEERLKDLKLSVENKIALLSTLSHEIRTPLTVIQSSVDIILEGRTGPLTDAQTRFLESSAVNVRRLITLSENILGSIKVERPWFKVILAPLDIRKLIINVARQMEPILTEKHQSMRYSFPKWLPRPMGDDTWIQQVLINLVHNASKHLAHGGSILISVTENEQYIVVSVSDDGSGMKNFDRVRVFGEFYQGGGDSSGREMDGFGLGLTIVQRVIEKHGGKVYVGSVEQIGTTVSFTLPKYIEGRSGK